MTIFEILVIGLLLGIFIGVIYIHLELQINNHFKKIPRDEESVEKESE